MTHGSLFSGIGGFDLAAQWMGWENKFHCEWNEFGKKVLNYYWPNAESFHDITKTDFKKYDGTIDIISGGFPCQPYSVAGKRLGKEDERHLWPEMLRAIQEIKPRWVVGENVRGLVGWNGGLVFEEVQTDLENAGYEVQPFLLPAASVNAPHKRDRVWFIAYANNKGRRSESEYISEKNGEISKWDNNAESCDSDDFIIKNSLRNGRLCGEFDKKRTENGEQRDFSPRDCNGIYKQSDTRYFTNSKSERQPSQQTRATELQSQIGKALHGRSGNGYGKWWENFPIVSPICNGDDGFSSRLDSITFSKWRKESIKAGGNAIVPQVALQIFKAIQEYETRFGGGKERTK